jgi:hypothetical protein
MTSTAERVYWFSSSPSLFVQILLRQQNFLESILLYVLRHKPRLYSQGHACLSAVPRRASADRLLRSTSSLLFSSASESAHDPCRTLSNVLTLWAKAFVSLLCFVRLHISSISSQRVPQVRIPLNNVGGPIPHIYSKEKNHLCLYAPMWMNVAQRSGGAPLFLSSLMA